MALQGTFDVLEFDEVLRLLARRELTGRLQVRHRSFAANLFVDGGHLTGADQSEHHAAASNGDVAGRIREICFEVLDADRGSFEWHPGKSGSSTGVRHTVDTVLDEARARLEQWRKLQEGIPSLDLQPRLVGALHRDEVTIDQERWRVLTAVDGRRTLRSIGRLLDLADFDVCRVVASLVADGVVELVGRSALAAAGAPPPGHDLTVTPATASAAPVDATPETATPETVPAATPATAGPGAGAGPSAEVSRTVTVGSVGAGSLSAAPAVGPPSTPGTHRPVPSGRRAVALRPRNDAGAETAGGERPHPPDEALRRRGRLSRIRSRQGRRDPG